MGNIIEEDDVVCIDCDKRTQKDLPSNDTTSSSGMKCEQIYEKVASCMTQNDGQVSACVTEWDKFKRCHSGKD